eukprot:GEZU01024219.1.p1 GENE.GEZU01024219.1~~GEZU01024219.1.p1  ORF type:complete len:107 (+),score=15.09 GEZU01024219.1:126-446(+)
MTLNETIVPVQREDQLFSRHVNTDIVSDPHVRVHEQVAAFATAKIQNIVVLLRVHLEEDRLHPCRQVLVRQDGTLRNVVGEDLKPFCHSRIFKLLQDLSFSFANLR